VGSRDGWRDIAQVFGREIVGCFLNFFGVAIWKKFCGVAPRPGGFMVGSSSVLRNSKWRSVLGRNLEVAMFVPTG
jgi:hypothetical protein